MALAEPPDTPPELVPVSAGKVVTLGRRLVASNQVFDIYFDHLAEDGGREVPAYLVVAPKVRNANLVSGVSVLPEMDGRLGMLRLYRHATAATTWEVPRGFVDSGESDEVSAVRELAEEAGLTTESSCLESLGCMAPEAGLIAARVHLFIARGCRRVGAWKSDEIGHEELRWFTADEAMALTRSGQVEDPSTLLLLYGYLLGLGRRAATP